MILKDKIAVVTGASGGIGKAIAELFAKNGAHVTVTSRTLDRAEKLADELKRRYNGRYLALKVDVTNPQDTAELFRRVRDEFNRLDILVNAAGAPLEGDLWSRPFHDITDDDYLRITQVDLLGAIRCCREAVKVMMTQHSGVIINISSTPALAGYDKGAPYTVAKAALLGLAKHLAYEYAPHNIRVYAVAPGNIATEHNYQHLDESTKRSLADEAPMKRWGRPEEVAGICLILSSEYSSFVTGQTIVVDGGTVMR